jgi:hypothetical protein
MFIPRHPVIENQFCQFAASSVATGAGNVLAYAGSACYLDTTADATVKIYAADEQYECFGFLMQKVKTGYHSIHPAGMVLPGDLGSSDVIAQPSYNTNGVIDGSKAAPVGVAHLGIWDTIHYWNNSLAMVAGDPLGVRATSISELTGQAASMNTLADGSSGELLNRKVAIVLKGATAAQVIANQNNITLYPVRIKLLK